VLITGASRGIGAGIARALARDGYDLILWSRDTHELAAVAKQLATFGTSIDVAGVDVADAAAVAAEQKRSLDRADRLNGLVICAGVGEWSPLVEVTDEQWDTTLDTNLKGAFHVLRAALPLLELVPYSHVILLGSDSSETGMAGRAAYCSSKWGLRGLGESLRGEVRPRRIKVTQILVSRVDTYFRGHKPGDRPGALLPKHIAGVVSAIFAQEPKVEIREIRMASMDASYGA
jgi:NADP-dependent 3-hydroxy acid dehydrogenase YdfG